jgi:23S rRNA (uridine2552-2'-O)-methyltransferase
LQRGYICDKSKKMTGNRWDDYYARQARKEKWLARSVYNLQEIDKKYKLIRKGDQLLDLGCYPGSWSQYGISKVGPQGELVGIDLTFPDRLSYPNFRFIQGDVLTIQIEWLAREISPRNLVTSDLAPQTTGIRLTDVSRSMLLSKRAAEVARALLKEKGHFVCKVFEGQDMVSFRSEISKYFRQVRAIRPKATRKGSKEIYLVGLEFVKGRV